MAERSEISQRVVVGALLLPPADSETSRFLRPVVGGWPTRFAISAELVVVVQIEAEASVIGIEPERRQSG
jgi:hypothetical protein